MRSGYLLIATSYAGFVTYGISYAEYDGTRQVLIETYPDLSHLVSRIQRLVDACNRDLLPRCQLRQTVESFLSSL